MAVSTVLPEYIAAFNASKMTKYPSYPFFEGYIKGSLLFS